jgi:uncharacterized protein (UPF0210 family)
MKIRSITCFYDPSARYALRTLGQLGRFARAARLRFEATGFAVQTTRLAAPPFPRLTPTCCDQSAVQLAQSLESQAAAEGFDYLSLGPALPEYPQSYALIPEMIAATRQVFFGGLMGMAGQGIHPPAIRACAAVIARAAAITPDGFANLRFAALANVPLAARSSRPAMPLQAPDRPLPWHWKPPMRCRVHLPRHRMASPPWPG